MVEPAERRRVLDIRLTVVREAVGRAGGRGALLSSRRNFAWLTLGGANHVVVATEIGAAPILVTAERAIVLFPNNEFARLIDEELGGLSIEIEAIDWFATDGIGRRAAGICPGRLLDDVSLEDDLRPIRSILGAAERSRMRWLGRRLAADLVAAAAGVAPGWTEWAAAAALASDLERSGIRAPAILAAADDRIERFRHPLPGATTAQRRMMLVVVAERWGLHVAATAFAELEPRSADLDRRFEVLAGLQRAMQEASRPGRTLGDVLAVARDAYARAGFPDEWRLQHQGGTIGYQPRERIAVPGDPTLIQPANALAWNPSITGAKLEATFIVGEDGPTAVTGAADG